MWRALSTNELVRIERKIAESFAQSIAVDAQYLRRLQLVAASLAQDFGEKRCLECG